MIIYPMGYDQWHMIKRIFIGFVGGKNLQETMVFPIKYRGLMWLKQCHKPPMTGNDNHSTFIYGDLGDDLYKVVLATITLSVQDMHSGNYSETTYQ